MQNIIAKYLLSTLCFFMSFTIMAENEITISISSDIEIMAEKYPSNGDYLILWLAPEYGLREGHRAVARLLTKHGIEVWQTNISESLFLPQGTSSIKKLNGNYVADIIEYAHKATRKKIVVLGDAYASISALRGAHQWQRRKQAGDYFIGAILFSPYTYASIPPLGQLPQYMPIISATNIPLIIYQSNKSGTFSQFKVLLNKLEQHNNPVYTRILPNMMSLFYSEKPTKQMINHFKPISLNIKNIIPILERHKVPRDPVKLKTIKQHKSGVDIYLKEYQGLVAPLAIHLNNAQGNKVEKNNYKGQVTIINFWATWCPPCVEEIPSLNRLKSKMKGLPFELISINYAEDKKTILEFMKKVKVDFPVLLDPDGNYAKKWNVITYPSTFVIDKNGNIKYGVNAAIEWDSPEFIAKIKTLLNP